MPTSTDGVVTAEVHEGWAYVALTVDTSVFAPAATQVQVWRSARGVESLVRSGDPAAVTGGTAVAVDTEAPLGVPVEFWVVAGGAASTRVTVILPLGERDAWLKSVHSPGLAALVEVVNLTDVAYAQPGHESRVIGRPDPVFELDAVETLPSGTLVLRVRSREEYDLVGSILRAGPMLMQASEAHGLFAEDVYLQRRPVVGIDRPGDLPGWELRLFAIPVQQIARPATAGAPLRIPGRSYADRLATGLTYAQAEATGETYLQNLTGA